MALLVAMIATRGWDVPPYFQISNWGARDLDGQYSTDVRLIFVFFSRLFAQPIAGHMQKENAEMFAAEINKFLCFILVVLWSLSGWPVRYAKSAAGCISLTAESASTC